MRLFPSADTNVQAVLFGLIKELKVKVTKATSDKYLLEHPEHQSLLSMSEGLSYWGVENASYRINFEDYNRNELLFPFVAYMSENHGRFILVKSINKNGFKYLDEVTGNGWISEDDFLKNWNGTLLHAEPTNTSGEVQYYDNVFKSFLQQLKLPMLLIVVFLAMYMSWVDQSYKLAFSIIGVLKMIGVAACSLLLVQSVDASNPFIKSLCGIGGGSGCTSILQSDSAKITSWLSWSEVGLFYFTGSLILLIINPSSLKFLAWINLCALPYPVYSIFYQYRSKSWCLLCCTVQALLVLEFFFFFWISYEHNFLLYHITELPNLKFLFISVFIAFTFPIIVWAFLKPHFKNANRFYTVMSQLKKFKYNADLFNRALTSQPRIDIPEELSPVILGNSIAKTVVTMISNPYCDPCSQAHAKLEELLDYLKDIQIRIIHASSNFDTDMRKQFALHINALNRLQDERIITEALKYWYKQDNKNFKKWSEKFPVTTNALDQKLLEKQIAWCESVGIKHTPTLFVNGYVLQEPYKIDDLKFLLN